MADKPQRRGTKLPPNKTYAEVMDSMTYSAAQKRAFKEYQDYQAELRAYNAAQNIDAQQGNTASTDDASTAQSPKTEESERAFGVFRRDNYEKDATGKLLDQDGQRTVRNEIAGMGPDHALDQEKYKYNHVKRKETEPVVDDTTVNTVNIVIENPIEQQVKQKTESQPVQLDQKAKDADLYKVI